jgi:hypothetical protein
VAPAVFAGLHVAWFVSVTSSLANTDTNCRLKCLAV